MARQFLTALAVEKELQDHGIPVVREPGWEQRGSSTFSPRGLVVHHTAGAATGDYPSLGIVRDGNRAAGIPGPLAQWGLGRKTVRLIACGRANHAGRGGWRGLSGNASVWGIEGESTGRGDWTPFQRFAYPRLAAALARHQPFSVDMICAHREWAPRRKPDPVGIDMPSFRAEVAQLLRGGPSPVNPPTPSRPRFQEEPMIWSIYGGWYLLDGGTLSHIADGPEPAFVKQCRAQGVPVVAPDEKTYQNRIKAGTEARADLAARIAAALKA